MVDEALGAVFSVPKHQAVSREWLQSTGLHRCLSRYSYNLHHQVQQHHKSYEAVEYTMWLPGGHLLAIQIHRASGIFRLSWNCWTRNYFQILLGLWQWHNWLHHTFTGIIVRKTSWTLWTFHCALAISKLQIYWMVWYLSHLSEGHNFKLHSGI